MPPAWTGIWMMAAVLGLSDAGLALEMPEGPRVVAPNPANEGNLIALPDGAVAYYFTDMHAGEIRSIRSSDGGETWTEPAVEFTTPGPTHHACEALLDQHGEVHVFFLHKRGKGRPNQGYHVDVFHRATRNGRTAWGDVTPVFAEGYVGAIRGSALLENGRMVVAFGIWEQPGQPFGDAVGQNATTSAVSDDGGRTWELSPARLTVPVYPNINGSGYGAVEPALIPLLDGRVWMLIRTQTGYLYESFSPDGLQWSEALATPFASSFSPAAALRLRDDRLVLFWHNAAVPPRVEGKGVYGGRDALHAAISADDGKTWHGFREVYLDPTRNQSPPKRGDRGAAYVNACETADGRVLVATGQGDHGARAMLRFHPDWVVMTEREAGLADGDLEEWSVFSEFGPAANWWRDRKAGAEIVPHPDQPGGFAMRLRRPADLPGDAAVWNFPGVERGEVRLRLRREAGAGPLEVLLMDRFFNPSDATAGEQSLFRLAVDDGGKMINSASTLPEGESVELLMSWDVSRRVCLVFVDGEYASAAPLIRETAFGPSYLRVANTGAATNGAGWLIEAVEARAVAAAASSD